MASISNYNKHTTLSERIKIENGLNNGWSLRAISKEIYKSVSTVSREIKNRRYKERGNFFNSTPRKCSKLAKAPFVCNSCPDVKKCRLSKFFYQAEYAHQEYLKLLKESREGIDQTTTEFKELDNLVKEDIDKGHSFALILHNHPELNVCERTLYYYQEKGYLSSKNIDLPRKVRYKKRKRNTNSSPQNKKDQSCRKGRTYKDFLAYLQSTKATYYTEMDTVEGIIGSGQPCLLTLYLKETSFLFIFKISEQTVTCVFEQIRKLKTVIGNEMFHKIFPIILTDNGSEFKRPEEIEDNGKHVLNSKVFYCDGGRSDQKSQIELSHEYIRRYIPKGVSMNKYTDQNILDMMCHINSTPRKSLGWKTPYDLTIEKFGERIFKELGIYRVGSQDVLLNDQLFYNKETN